MEQALSNTISSSVSTVISSDTPNSGNMFNASSLTYTLEYCGSSLMSQTKASCTFCF